MQVNIGAKIKELRKRDGRTQDAMANAIGVTAQAISRWEANGGYPDMEIVPSIANYFGITIDELFGYECERQSKIDNLVQNIYEKNKLNNGENICIDECIADARNGLIEFPGNEKLMLCLASILYNAGYAKYGEHHLTDENGYDVFDVPRHKQYAEWQEAIKLYEKLLLSLGDGEMRHTAVRELVQLYENTGENEKAKQIAANSPDISICRELLMLNCCDGKERAEEYEKALGEIVSVASDLLVSTVMMNKNHYSPKKSVEKINQAIRLFEIIEDDCRYSAKIAHLYLYLSEHQWKAGDHDGAFDSLEMARIFAEHYDTALNLIGCTNATSELPDVWPWWCVPDFAEVSKEIKADPRWATWKKKCNG